MHCRILSSIPGPFHPIMTTQNVPLGRGNITLAGTTVSSWHSDRMSYLLRFSLRCKFLKAGT